MNAEIKLDSKATSYLKETLGGEGGESIEFVEIDKDATQINQETLEKLVDPNNPGLKPNFIVLTTQEETDSFPILIPSDNLQYIYRSAVISGKYYELKITLQEEGAVVSITEVSVGGGSEVYAIQVYSKSIYPTSINLTVDTQELSTYSDLANYLSEKGYNEGNYCSAVGDYTDDDELSHLVVGISNSYGELAVIYVDTPSYTAILPDNEYFSITYLGQNNQNQSEE